MSTSMFFFLLIWRPALATLFPYTTLFRSRAAGGDGGLRELLDGLTPEAQQELLLEQLLAQLAHVLDTTPERIDRKSTRLNSSHVKISYAVFCLKKKTQKS